VDLTWPPGPQAAAPADGRARGTPFGHDGSVIFAAVVIGVVALLSGSAMIALFVWGAIKDGEDDDALQRRLGIRRRTRLGR